MKKLFCCIAIALLLCLAAGGSMQAYAAEDNTSDDVYKFVSDLCALRRDGSDVSEFVRLALEQALSGSGSVRFAPFTEGEKVYRNIEATLGNVNARQYVVIGAHYDATGEGAGDNTCGVAALWQVARLLAPQAVSLPFGVRIVAFDGEEEGMLGSYNYAQSLTPDDVLLMVNIDSIAVGDELYVQCENKPTTLASLLLDKFDGAAQAKPYTKGLFTAIDMYGYGYYETTQNSDHTPFRLLGIPTALIFSGSYSVRTWNYAESADPDKNVMNTLRDTFDNLAANSPNFPDRVRSVANAVAATLTDGQFPTVAANARSELINLNAVYNSLWPGLAVLALTLILSVACWLYYRKLQKRALLGTADVKQSGVFSAPSSDEIFTFKGDTKGDADDADDIFTFGK